MKFLLENIVDGIFPDDNTKSAFKSRIEEENFSKSENHFSHFCVYFPAYDPENKLVFIGLHKKSGLWLFNGGHIEKSETPHQALKREIAEEWGTDIGIENDLNPELLTITHIEKNPVGRLCKTHYDIWFFIAQDSKKFSPDESLLKKEFYEIGWKTFDEARILAKDPITAIGINKIKEIVCK